MTKHLTTLPDYHQFYQTFRKANPEASIGLVPTLGALHDGHMALVKASLEQCDLTVVYIFLNPMQFAPHEDFDSYPRTLESDLAQCQALGVDVVFSPAAQEIYPHGTEGMTQVVPPAYLTQRACGLSRPVFFTGIATVLTKMFTLLRPDVAFFGHKDAQQLRIVQQLVEDLNLPLSIVPVATVRESSGLAMSSRNQKLSSATARQQALLLSQLLTSIQQLYQRGHVQVDEVKHRVLSALTEVADPEVFELDYCIAVDQQSFQEVSVINDNTRWLVAAQVAGVRLIDNALVSEPAVAQLGLAPLGMVSMALS